MDDDLEKLWSKFKLSKKKEDHIVIQDEWVDGSDHLGCFCPVGHMMASRRYNLEAIKNVLGKDRDLMKQPWSYKKSLVVLNEYDGSMEPTSVNLDWCPFWIQMNRLSLRIMTEKVGIVLREAIDEVKEIETCG
ncbi:hypothetical protein PTKIN_Ptkin04bG0102700 [Pterospermum kingtungense]